MTKEVHNCGRRKTGNARSDQARQTRLKSTENKMTVLARNLDHEDVLSRPDQAKDVPRAGLVCAPRILVCPSALSEGN
jgi:hypothetical protein